jgi:hypothetical protein
LLAAQFLVSSEVFVTLTILGIPVLALGYVLLADKRRILMRVAAVLTLAYCTALALLSPYLYYLLAVQEPSPGQSPLRYSADVTNFIAPTQITAIGHSWFAPLTARYTGNVFEDGAYLGLPLIGVVVAFALSRWYRPYARFLVTSFLVLLLAALGQRLHVAGTITMPLPWALVVHLPVIRQALPSRFVIYATLIAALIIALWLAERRSVLRWGVALAVLVSLAPNLGGVAWTAPLEQPPFFRAGTPGLGRSARVLIIPYGYRGDSLLWDAQADGRFQMVGGLWVTTPRSYDPARNPAIADLLGDSPTARVLAFVRSRQVAVVVVTLAEAARWRSLLSQLDVAPKTADGVLVYYLHPRSQAERTPKVPGFN